MSGRRVIVAIGAGWVVAACGGTGTADRGAVTDSAAPEAGAPATDPRAVVDRAASAPPADSLARIRRRADSVVAALMQGRIAIVADLTHPVKGVRFSPYPHVTVADQRFLPDQVRQLPNDTTRYRWGVHDGSGAPIQLRWRDYATRFIRDYDFTTAPQVAIDEPPMGKGNITNTVTDAYPGAHIVEYHVPGVEARYDGMDWRSLWVILEPCAGDWCLTGVVHGAWTI